ncbi:hypothetical protein DFH06DRAFT_1351822 [Mycena polygramma]|nr:hypothetical protein DFH06DRAFT_1351822 [Mycena polygramma]
MASLGRGDSTALFLRVRSLSAWSRDPKKMEKIAEVHSILQSLVEDMPWVEASVSIVASFLVGAVEQVRRGWPIPLAACSQTCLRITPVIEYIPIDQRDDRSALFTTPAAFDASPTPVAPGELSDLDHVMKMFFRLLPQLRPADAIPGFASYLGKRGDLHAIGFATADCRPTHLRDCLISTLQPHRRDEELLCALSAVYVLHHEYKPPIWDDNDEHLWNYMTQNRLFSIPTFSTLSVMMRLRKYDSIRISAIKLADTETIGTSPNPVQISQLQELSDHFLLPERQAPISTLCTPKDIVVDIRNRVTQAKVVPITEYLTACLQAVRPMYMTDAVRSLLVQFFQATLEAVDFQVLADFCQAWMAIIHQLLESPTDSELNDVAGGILEWVHRWSDFRYPAPAPLIKDAMSLHLKFLETHASEEPYLEQTKRVVEQLSSLEAVGG